MQTLRPVRQSWAGQPVLNTLFRCGKQRAYARRRPPRLPPRPPASPPLPAGLLNWIHAPPCGSLLVNKLAARMASISLPGRAWVDPRPNRVTKVSSSISGGRMIPAASTAAFFSAILAWVTGKATGFMIAEVIPAPIAMGKKALLIPWRFGRPNDTFEAPQVVFTPNSSRRRRTNVKTCWPAVAIAPIGITNGSTTIS